MGISLMTYWMIQGNEVRILQAPYRWEAWLIKDKHPHALLLSCPLDKLSEFENYIKEVKKEAGEEWQSNLKETSNA